MVVGLRQGPRDVAEHRCDGDGGLDGPIELLPQYALHPGSGERLLDSRRSGDGFPEAPRVAGEAETDAGPPRPPLVRRPDPAAGRSQLGGAARRLAREIEGAVAGEHDVGAGETSSRDRTTAWSSSMRISSTSAVGSITTPGPIRQRQPGWRMPEGMQGGKGEVAVGELPRSPVEHQADDSPLPFMMPEPNCRR